jgi:hypothetical protein
MDLERKPVAIHVLQLRQVQFPMRFSEDLTLNRYSLLIVAALALCLGFALAPTGAPHAAAAGAPVVEQAVGAGGQCVNGSYRTNLGCTAPLNPIARIVCPPNCGVTYPWNYNYPNDWRFYSGDSWVYCTWPGGSGWLLNGTQSSFMFCS